MSRNQEGADWRAKLALYLLASWLGGAVSGLALGTIGSLVPATGRAAAASLLALGAVAVGAGQLLNRGVGVLQCDRETPQSWLHRGPVQWALRNGLSLGCGATTRIGFWLWYVVPAGALLSGSPLLGAGLYGAYGLTRGLGVTGLIALFQRDAGMSQIQSLKQPARIIADGHLALVGLAILIGIGM